MRHEYVNIPELPEPLRDLHWERQRIARDLGRAQTELDIAHAAFMNILMSHIEINEKIRQEEEK